MPGGLVRVLRDTGDRLGDSALLAGQNIGEDVWVLSEGPVSRRSAFCIRKTRRFHCRCASGNDLPSRVADNLYWLGRHVERAESAIRLLRSVVTRLTSESEVGYQPELPLLLEALAEQGPIRPEFVVHTAGQETPLVEQEILAFIFDAKRNGSLRDTLDAMRHVASIVRDRISLDSWRILNRVEQDSYRVSTASSVQFGEVLTMLNQMIVDLWRPSAAGMESMIREARPWRFP